MHSWKLRSFSALAGVLRKWVHVRLRQRCCAGMRIVAIALIALVAVGKTALAANRRLLADTDTASPMHLFQAFVG